VENQSSSPALLPSWDISTQLGGKFTE